MNVKSSRSGFTLVELLVTIAVIGILTGMLFPAIQTVRNAARRSSCQNNLRQVILASHNYEASHMNFPKADNGDGGSLFLRLSTYLDQEYIFQRSEEERTGPETWSDRWKELSSLPMPVVHCPSTTEQERESNLANHGKFTSHYLAIAGPVGNAVSTDKTKTYTYSLLSPEPLGGPVALDGLYSPTPKAKFDTYRGSRDIRDGTSNTLAFAELAYSPQRTSGEDTDRAGWAFGAKYDGSGAVEKIWSVKSIEHGINKFESGKTNALAFGSNHKGGCHFALADGAVKFVHQGLRLDIIKTLSSINQLEIPEQLEEE